MRDPGCQWPAVRRGGGRSRRRPGAGTGRAGRPRLRGPLRGGRLQHQLPSGTDEMAGPILAGWTMIEVFDTTAARIALARRMLGCPGCSQPLRPWGHAPERTVRDTGGTLVTVRPDRALCTGCRAAPTRPD